MTNWGVDFGSPPTFPITTFSNNYFISTTPADPYRSNWIRAALNPPEREPRMSITTEVPVEELTHDQVVNVLMSEEYRQLRGNGSVNSQGAAERYAVEMIEHPAAYVDRWHHVRLIAASNPTLVGKPGRGDRRFEYATVDLSHGVMDHETGLFANWGKADYEATTARSWADRLHSGSDLPSSLSWENEGYADGRAIQFPDRKAPATGVDLATISTRAISNAIQTKEYQDFRRNSSLITQSRADGFAAEIKAHPEKYPDKVISVRAVFNLLPRLIETEEEFTKREAEAALAGVPIDPSTGKPYEQLKGDDPRLVLFWKEAARVANEHQYCSQYDAMAKALDGPGRPKRKVFTLGIPVQATVYVTAEVIATSEEEARVLYERSNGRTLEEALINQARDTRQVARIVARSLDNGTKVADITPPEAGSVTAVLRDERAYD